MIIPIAVINYNGSKDTIAMIVSLVESGESFDVIIVDNKSPKEFELKNIAKEISEKYNKTIQKIYYKSEYTNGGSCISISETQIVTLLQGNDNYGFAIGTNIGLRYALERYPQAIYLAILNNDTIVTPNFLTRVVEGIKENDLAAAMGTILYYGYEKPYIWSIGGPIDYIKGQGIHLYKDSEYHPENFCNVFYKRDFISGCYTVFRRDRLLEINLLDEDYFFAGEEYQYSVDLTKKYTIGWIPKSVIYHKSVKGIGNGSSHTIKDLKWQYNAYMVKIVFMNKNKDNPYLWFWHLLFKCYIALTVKRRYKRMQYSEAAFRMLKDELFKNINRKSFTLRDFMLFATKIEKLAAEQ